MLKDIQDSQRINRHIKDKMEKEKSENETISKKESSDKENITEETDEQVSLMV